MGARSLGGGGGGGPPGGGGGGATGGAVADKYVWARTPPVCLDPDQLVPRQLIDEMMANKWDGMVKAGKFIIRGAAGILSPGTGGGGAKQGGGRGTATQALTNLGFRSADQFGPNYEMAVDVLKMIAAAHDNVEQYIHFNYFD